MPSERPIYGIDDRPRSLWACLLFGWQHTLVDISPFVLPLAVAGALGFSDGETARLISFGLVGMGIATLIQTTAGNRLPIVQGPSATLTGTLAPVASQLGGGAMWGAVFAGALGETLIGALRVPGMLRRLFPPLVSGVVVVSIGLALGQVAVRLALASGRASDFLFAGGVIALILVLQFGLKRLEWLSRGAIFFSIWIVGLGAGGLAGEVNWRLVAEKPWFELPQFFPFGGPGFGWSFIPAAILAVFAGYLGSMVESIGDYAATCAAAGERLRARHIDRGILAEGVGCLTASALGGLPCTSYTQNIGIIAATRVASRFVVRIAALFLLAYGLCPKFGALLVALPQPVLGGVFLLVCAMIIASGLRLLEGTLRGPAESAVAGLPLAAAIAVPVYVQYGLGPDWLASQTTLARLILSNSVVLAVLLGVGLNALLLGTGTGKAGHS